MENLLAMMRDIISHYKRGELGRYEYMSQIHEFNKLLLGFQERLETSEIDSIEITRSGVKLSLANPEIKIYIDGSCGSAPITSLNFGENERQELNIALAMLKDEDAPIIFDVGAHIGWYSLIFGKRFPKASIYAFEPLPATYNFLKKNILENELCNIKYFNYGLYNSDCEEDFYYFRGGSAIASLRNLIDHDKTQLVRCSLKKMDAVANSLKIHKLDFLKCDVEGAEIFVFEGGKTSIKKNLPIIFAEICGYWCEKFNYKPDDIRSMLEEWGYRCFSPHKSSSKLQEHLKLPDYSIDYNYFFLHKEKHETLINSFIY